MSPTSTRTYRVFLLVGTGYMSRVDAIDQEHACQQARETWEAEGASAFWQLDSELDDVQSELVEETAS